MSAVRKIVSRKGADVNKVTDIFPGVSVWYIQIDGETIQVVKCRYK